jgi:hypothetical protein
MVSLSISKLVSNDQSQERKFYAHVYRSISKLMSNFMEENKKLYLYHLTKNCQKAGLRKTRFLDYCWALLSHILYTVTPPS